MAASLRNGRLGALLREGKRPFFMLKFIERCLYVS